MKYELLILDADDTLFDFARAEEYALEHTMKELPIQYEKEVHLPLYSKINEAIWKEFEQGAITQKKLKTERFGRFAAALQMDLSKDSLAAAYEKYLGDASFLFDGSLSLVESLHEHYRMIIITNGLTSVQENRIKKSVIAPFFEDIIISESVGLSKPDKQIFEHALHSIHFEDKKKTLIIGDSLSSDIKGGSNAGIDTCWYNPHRLQNQSSTVPTYEVFDFAEIKRLLL